MVTLRIEADSTLVRQGLENLSKAIPDIGRRKIFETMNRITRAMEAYPPERPGQTYKRTGTLGFSWYVKRLEGGYQVYSTARNKYGHRYTLYVVGGSHGQGQAWMHKGRWQLFRDVVEAEVKKLAPEIVAELKMVARKNNLVMT